MIISLTFAEFQKQFGHNSERQKMLLELEEFLNKLRSNFSNYRILVYGSFLSQESEPGDIDVMVSVNSVCTDPGFNKFSELQSLATGRVHVFTLNLKDSFEDATVPNAQSMLSEFDSRPAHIAKGIRCTEVIELI